MTAMTNYEPQPQAELNILTSIDQAATGIRGAKESVEGIGERIVPHSPRAQTTTAANSAQPVKGPRRPGTPLHASRACHSPTDHYGPLNSTMFQSVQSLEAARP
jgi:hypothetical protein